MHYTLADLLEGGILPSARLLTGEGDFSKVVIDSVSVQELPLDDFIQKNELVLSTAIGCDRDPQRYLQLIQGARQAHGAAIAFAFREDGRTIPPEILRQAGDLPVFQIPWEYRFSAIQSAVLDAIREKEVAVFKEVQNKLFNLFFETSPLDEAARYIAQTLEVGVQIFNRAGELRGSSREEEAPPPPDAPSLEVEILISSMVFGKLRILAEAGAADPAENRHLFEQYVAFPLALWFNRKNIEDLTATQLKNDFVHNLATGNYDSFSQMVQQGANLHFDLARPYTCIVLKASLNGEKEESIEYSNRTARTAAEIEEILLREGARRGMKIMVSNLSLEFIVFLENLPPAPQEGVEAYLDGVDRRIRQTFPNLTLLWGFSEIRLEPQDFSRLYRNARLALQYCAAAGDGSRRFAYKDTRKALIVSVLSENPQILQNAQEVLGALMAYDARSDVGLMGTLTCYIANNYHISKTARDLHIHRQSLLYRLEKIQHLTGLSLDDHNDLFVLEVFSRIHRPY